MIMQEFIEHHLIIGLAAMVLNTIYSNTCERHISHNVYYRRFKLEQPFSIRVAFQTARRIASPSLQALKNTLFHPGFLPVRQIRTPSQNTAHGRAIPQPSTLDRYSSQKAAPGAYISGQQNSLAASPGRNPNAVDSVPLPDQKNPQLKTSAPAFRVFTSIKRGVMQKGYTRFFLPTMLNDIQWFNPNSALGIFQDSQPFCPGAEPISKAGNVKGWQQ